MGESRWDKMCQGDKPNFEYNHVPKCWHGQEIICGGIKHNTNHESACPFPQHHNSLRVQKRCTYLSAHHPAGQNVNSRATGRPCNLCRLHTLVPPWTPRHMERVPLHTYYLSWLTTRGTSSFTSSLCNSLHSIFFFGHHNCVLIRSFFYPV